MEASLPSPPKCDLAGPGQTGRHFAYCGGASTHLVDGGPKTRDPEESKGVLGSLPLDAPRHRYLAILREPLGCSSPNANGPTHTSSHGHTHAHTAYPKNGEQHMAEGLMLQLSCGRICGRSCFSLAWLATSRGAPTPSEAWCWRLDLQDDPAASIALARVWLIGRRCSLHAVPIIHRHVNQAARRKASTPNSTEDGGARPRAETR